MRLIHAAVRAPNPSLPEIALRVDRITLAKRLWRGVADDRTEFGFELGVPLQHGDVVFESAAARYVIAQQPEPVVEIPLEFPPVAAAGIGWAIGNLHLQLAGEPSRLLALDEPAVRRLLDRLQVTYRCSEAVFRPGRFARGAHSTHELGLSHQH